MFGFSFFPFHFSLSLSLFLSFFLLCQRILGDAPLPLQPEAGTVVLLLFRQRFYLEQKDLLIAGYRAAPAGCKSRYLRALANVLANVPKQVLGGELAELLPLLLDALSLPVDNVKLSCLDILHVFVAEAPEPLTRALDSLIPAYLALCQHQVCVVRVCVCV